MSTLKICKRCEEEKEISFFSKARSNKDGYNRLCKKCIAEKAMLYYKTLPGLFSKMYNSACGSSQHRGHPAPEYTKQEMISWLYANGIEKLFANWVKHNYDKELAPSIDRLDSNFPYTFSNIRLVTWKENNEAAYEERKSCKHITKQNRKIEQLTSAGEHVKIYDSISQAARLNGFCRTNINYVCQGNRELAHGYIWCYI